VVGGWWCCCWSATGWLSVTLDSRRMLTSGAGGAGVGDWLLLVPLLDCNRLTERQRSTAVGC
jgi:hypothetical protein